MNGAQPPCLLDVRNLGIRYAGLPVIHGVSLHVAAGETVSVVGANGAGKSSLLRGIMGAQRAFSGEILFEGRQIRQCRTEEIVRLGIVYVPEERMLFGPLPVEENLMLGAYVLGDRRRIQENLTGVYDLFPRLRERRFQAAATLSGGEQQMVAIGRGLMSNPRLLMLDEPSLGLAPLLVSEVFGTVRRLKARGMSILLVEQNVQEGLDLADRAYVIQSGSVILQGRGRELLGDDLIRQAYLGL